MKSCEKNGKCMLTDIEGRALEHCEIQVSSNEAAVKTMTVC